MPINAFGSILSPMIANLDQHQAKLQLDWAWPSSVPTCYYNYGEYFELKSLFDGDRKLEYNMHVRDDPLWNKKLHKVTGESEVDIVASKDQKEWRT